MAKKSVFDQDYWERKHKRQLNARARYVKQLFDDLARKVASLGIDINLPSEKEFRLEDYPALNKRIDEMVREVAKKVTHNIEEGEEEAWLLSNAKNDALVDYVTQGVKLPKDVVSGWKNQNLLALSAFQARKIAGMTLSQRVWNLTQTAKQELELALDIGIGEGKSADELSRDIRQYLNEPNKLFRRVRDERGILRLSKAAKMYHPGKGVYRSSYKNALRLTQTETNMAYRSADHERWQQLSFVIGQRINLSNNHTLNGVPFYDICDELAGVYPKDFKFVGWHPKCRCYKTSELAKREERIEYLKKIANGEDVSDFKFSGQVKDMPDKFGMWLEKNAERIQRAEKRGTLPYFLRDNKKYFERTQKQPIYQGAKLGRKASKEAYKTYENTQPISLSKEQLQNISEIAGAFNTKLTPMSFLEANSGKGNVHLGEDALFEQNCQSCVVVHEARLRGLNITAKAYNPNKNSVQWLLGESTADIWIKPNTTKKPTTQRIVGKDDDDLIRRLEKQMQAPGRYHVGINTNDNIGHIITAEKLVKGGIVYYDPQTGDFINIKEYTNLEYFELLKVDKLLLNKDMLLEIAELL